MLDHRARRLAVVLVALLAGPVLADDIALTFEDRARGVAAIERVYHAHREGETRTFEDAVPRALIERKVRDAIGQERALERFWGVRFDAHAIEREIARMARDTRNPERLRELWAALGDDPVAVGEILARPTLVRRRIEAAYKNDPSAGGHFAVDDPPAPFGAWWREIRDRFVIGASPVIADPGATLPDLTDHPEAAGSCAPRDRWDSRSLDIPTQPMTDKADSVWTGSEVLIWGRTGAGVRYDPATDTWGAMNRDDAPTGRWGHSVVWTGSEMIVWGGEHPDDSHPDDGAAYDPTTDTWRVVRGGPAVGGPDGRHLHCAVWSGTEMLLYGGAANSGTFFDGFRYDPVSDTWTPMNLVGAPGKRSNFACVWTGSEYIAWGRGTPPEESSSGARYDPVTDTWTPMSTDGAPTAWVGERGVWTGAEMIVWSGSQDPTVDVNGRYSPSTDSWSPMSDDPTGIPHCCETLVWTGTELLVFGDYQFRYSQELRRYDPTTDTWVVSIPPGTPSGRHDHTATWIGDRMFVWSGRGASGSTAPGWRALLTGGLYDPVTDSWTPTSVPGPQGPVGRGGHTAIWTGSEMVVWGGEDGNTLLRDGARYDPATDAWSSVTDEGAPGQPRSLHTAVWTGTEMIVWGGYTGALSNARNGARYDVASDSWSNTLFSGSPTGRSRHVAVWDGSGMLIWGGQEDTSGKTPAPGGARYSPSTNSWTPMSQVGQPRSRYATRAVWTGDEMLVWGGEHPREGVDVSGSIVIGEGGAYDPVTDTWRWITDVDAPSPRRDYAATWIPDRGLFAIWGGSTTPIGEADTATDSGGLYDPVADTWTPISTTGAPVPRIGPEMVATGTDLVVWGGFHIDDALFPDGNDWDPREGGRYDTVAGAWTEIPQAGAPPAARGFTAVGAGDDWLVWGGGLYKSGGRLGLTGGFDGDGDGISECVGDCDDTNPSIWATPGAVAGLAFGADKATLTWNVPEEPGADVALLLYDTVRSDVPSDFTGSLCLETGGNDLQSTDAASPETGAAYHYLVRATNPCPGGPGSSGETSDGSPREVPACP